MTVPLNPRDFAVDLEVAGRCMGFRRSSSRERRKKVTRSGVPDEATTSRGGATMESKGCRTEGSNSLRVLLSGIVGLCFGMIGPVLHGGEEAAPPSILIESPAEEESMSEESPDSSSASSLELKRVRRAPTAGEGQRLRMVDPHQLIYERAAREARAREARLESRRWQGISSTRPSNGWVYPDYSRIGYSVSWPQLWGYGPVSPYFSPPYPVSSLR